MPFGARLLLCYSLFGRITALLARLRTTADASLFNRVSHECDASTLADYMPTPRIQLSASWLNLATALLSYMAGQMPVHSTATLCSRHLQLQLISSCSSAGTALRLHLIEVCMLRRVRYLSMRM